MHDVLQLFNHKVFEKPIMYSPYVSFILGSMVVTGAARSIVAKLFYQVGFEHPLFLTLLYLGGQALSLIPYNIWRYFDNRKRALSSNEDSDGDFSRDELEASALSFSRRLSQSARMSSARFAHSVFTNEEALPASERRDTYEIPNRSIDGITPKTDPEGGYPDRKQQSRIAHDSQAPDAILDNRMHQSQNPDTELLAKRSHADKQQLFHNDSSDTNSSKTATPKKMQQQNFSSTTTSSSCKKSNTANRRTFRSSQSVSIHGLPPESKTERFVSRIPWYLKPTIPALFNLLNSAMRWASLVFVAASVAEMLISGMELVLSVLATRCVRGRKVTLVRWGGVAVVTAGIIMVGIFDTMNAANVNGDESSSTDAHDSVKNQTIGILLILGQSVMSVIQDLTEELYMQEANFPPALLVGMEGSLGLIIALVLYFPIAPLLGERPANVIEDLKDGKIIGLSVGWALLVTVTGIFNIAATGVTSSMTRNVWKNFRTCLIWIVGLIIFYATGNPSLGEPWTVPGSFYILLGFSVMLIGIYIYYGKGARAG